MTIKVKQLGVVAFEEAFIAMREFNASRLATTDDEVWLLQHPPVYTLGLSANRQHLLNTGSIPVVETDRGGQVTYHGPGQLVVYILVDLERRPYAIKRFVQLIEQAVIDYLQSLDISADRKQGAPGVYVDGRKLAALGVRVKKGGTYHGLAINVDMDLTPYSGINPCGYAGLQCTQLSEFVPTIDVNSVSRDFPVYLLKHLDVTAKAMSDVA